MGIATRAVHLNDIHEASHTERMLLLSDGKIPKEKQGLHSIKKKTMCPSCHNAVQPSDKICPHSQKPLEEKV